MRRWIPFSFLAALAVIGTSPIWKLSGNYLFLADGFAHLFRFFDFDRSIHQGILYPRWAPDAAYGYGYPVLNFYSPLSYYSAEFLRLLGASDAQSILGTMALALVIALGGAYVLGRELHRREMDPNSAGWLTAAAYVFFPYFLLDIYARGALGEVFAAAILPWLFWSWRRVLTRRTLGNVVLNALFSAILVLSHNVIAYLAVPLLAAYTLWELLPLPRADRVSTLWRLVGSLALGAALAAIYWLPMIAELPLITGSRGTKQLATIMQNSFLPLTQLIQSSIPYQYTDDPYPLPLVPLLFGALAFGLALVVRRSKRFGWVAFFSVAAIVEMLFLLDWSKGIWLGFPFLSAAQFSWRITAFIGLCFAICIGSIPAMLSHWLDSAPPRLARLIPARFSRGWINAALSAILAIVLVWISLARLSPIAIDNPKGELSIGQMARYEVNSRAFGFVWLNEYMPLTVTAVPKQLPATTSSEPTPNVRLTQFRSDQRAFTIATPTSISVRFRTFYFPDWHATVDGQPAAAYASTAAGLLTVDIPAGDHAVVLSQGTTLPRQIGLILSAIGVLILLLLVVVVLRRREPELPGISLLLITGLIVFAPTAFTALTATPAALEPTQVDVTPALRMIGLTIDGARFNSSWRVTDAPASLNLQVEWQVKQSMPEKKIIWRLVDNTGTVWASRGLPPRYGTGFAAAWIPNELVQDQYDLPLAPAMPRGTYYLETAVEGQPFVRASTIELAQGSAPAPAAAPIAHSADALFGNNIRLIGYDAPATGRAGETIPITLDWQAASDLSEDLTVFVHLVDTDGKLVAQQDGLTQDGFYPTMLWIPNRVVVDRREIALPSTLPPGVYRLVAGLYRVENLARLPVTTSAGVSPDDEATLGEIKVPVSPPFAKPQHALDIAFGTAIQLAGFDWAAADASGNPIANSPSATPPRLVLSPGQGFGLKLYWQARARVGSDYKVFLHIVDSAGNLVAQQDQFPRNGKYPTRIWDAGEQIDDSYFFSLQDLAPGQYRIQVGLYAPDTGERLIARDGAGTELPDRQFEIGIEIRNP